MASPSRWYPALVYAVVVGIDSVAITSRIAGLLPAVRVALRFARRPQIGGTLLLVPPGHKSEVEADLACRGADDVQVMAATEATWPAVATSFVAGRPWIVADASQLVATPVQDDLVEKLAAGASEVLGVKGTQPFGLCAATGAFAATLPRDLPPIPKGDHSASSANVLRIALQSPNRSGPAGYPWCADLSDPAECRQAVSRLFDECRKPVDGFISRHLNRNLSIRVSRLFVNTPITPNGFTGVTFLVALAAAGFAAQGDYVAVAISGVLMQANSVLDGCDGELARVRHEGSKLGQWLDTVGDDISNVIYWAALGYGAASLHPWGHWLARAGFLTAAANLGAALLNYRILVALGSGDFYALESASAETSAEPSAEKAAGRTSVVGRIVAFFSVVLKQDFFLFLIMILAVAGVLIHSLPLLAVGAVITFLNSAARYRAWSVRRSKRRKLRSG